VIDRHAVVIVAHPDDEVLWAGGLILSLPQIHWHVLALTRRSDPDRAPRFSCVLQKLGASGDMADLDDGPEQSPLSSSEIQDAISDLLPSVRFDLVLTHGPRGEYTRHQRHEETCAAVAALWEKGRLFRSSELWLFAYEDGGRQYLPRAIENAHLCMTLPEKLWQTKYQLVTKTYGFGPESWEARVTPRIEAFWRFISSATLNRWLQTWH
jgi:LmbE family N-acetylglucosaminyl deacetylase